MKRILCSLFWVVLSASLLRADQAADLYAKAAADLARNDYAGALPLLDQIIADYPTTSNIDQIRLNAGIAYLHTGDYDKAVDRLAKEAADGAPAQYRGAALYYTGYAQLLKGGKAGAGAGKEAFQQSVETMGKLIAYAGASTSPDDKEYLEQAYYNRALAYLYLEDLPNAESDVNQLLQKFPGSLQKPDYILLLGNLYARDAGMALHDKKPDDEVRARGEQGDRNLRPGCSGRQRARPGQRRRAGQGRGALSSRLDGFEELRRLPQGDRRLPAGPAQGRSDPGPGGEREGASGEEPGADPEERRGGGHGQQPAHRPGG